MLTQDVPQSRFRLLIVLAFTLLALCISLSAQQTQPPKRPTDDDVVRVNTTLVQTDAMVFDKQGKFVEGLKPEQFILKVNGQTIPVSFVELVTSGSAAEKAQLESVRRGGPATVSADQPTPIPAAIARNVFIFVDDFHLESDSFSRMRRSLLSTIDKELSPGDRALVTAASGQLGPQSLTSDKAALRAVVERLAPRAGTRRSIERPAMTEYAAIAIEHGDTGILSQYVSQLIKDMPLTTFEIAEQQIKNRARDIVAQSEPLASNTLTSLESLIRDMASLPGRKLIFFLSDGFQIEDSTTNSAARFRSATQLAARSGVVIYSLNTRGLITTGPDATEGGTLNPRFARAEFSGDTAAQDVLYSLAADTGGRALVNNNDINAGVRRALEETSRYYLLAWRPPPEMSMEVKHVELAIAGRAGLKVMTRQRLAEPVAVKPLPNRTTAAVAAPAPASELLAAINGASPRREIPTSLVAVYRNVGPDSFAVTASLQLPTSALTFETVGARQAASVEVAGTVSDQTGRKVTGFNKAVDIPADSPAIDAARKLIFYNYDVRLAPGIYMLRLGIRDEKSRQIGSALQLVEIPRISSGKLALSSLMLNEQNEADDDQAGGESRGEMRGLAQRFARAGRLQFLTFVYNAKPATADDKEPDLSVGVKILRGDQLVSTPAMRELPIDNAADSKGYPLAGEVSLDGLPAGEYVLQVSITDLTTKTTATQQATIIVE